MWKFATSTIFHSKCMFACLLVFSLFTSCCQAFPSLAEAVVSQLPSPVKLSDLNGPAIIFKSDYSYDPTDYPLYAGMNVSIVYDLKRASCIPKDHADSWTVTMSYVWNNNFDNTIQSQIAYGDILTNPVYETPVIRLQQGDYQFWFQCSTGTGKTTYDSQFGRNFHIGVYPPRQHN